MPTLDFLGNGIPFPFKFSPAGGLKKTVGVKRASDVELINASLRYILSSQLGERVMRRDFGTSLRSLVFSPNDPSLDVLINYDIIESIKKYEKRIILEDVKIDRTFRDEGKLLIGVSYTIIQTNVRGNLVYPFYLNELTTDSKGGPIIP